MFVLVSLTLFQSTNVNISLLQTVIKLHLQLHFTSALLFIFTRCSIKVNVQKSRQSHLPVFWKFSPQNLGKSPKSLHTTSEWMNSNCHRLFSLCPLFHVCWKWGVRHSPSFAIPQLSPTDNRYLVPYSPKHHSVYKTVYTQQQQNQVKISVFSMISWKHWLNKLFWYILVNGSMLWQQLCTAKRLSPATEWNLGYTTRRDESVDDRNGRAGV